MDKFEDSSDESSSLENFLANYKKQLKRDSISKPSASQKSDVNNMQSMASTSYSICVGGSGALNKGKKKNAPKKAPKKTAKKKKPRKAWMWVGPSQGNKIDWKKDLLNEPQTSYLLDSSDEEVKHKSEPDPDYVPTTPHSYNKMTSKELDSIAKRIRVYHDTGVVVPAGDGTVPCQNRNKKKPKNTVPKERLPQVPGTTFGQGQVGVAWGTFGARRCACCTKVKDSAAPENGSSRTMYAGLLSMMSRNMAQRYVKQEERRLQLQTRELLSHPEITDSHRSEDSVQDEPPPPLPELTPDKRQWVQKFIDSMAAERIDYEKPEPKNTIEGILHTAITALPCDNSSVVDSSTIKERIDFKKRMERRSMLDHWLYKGSSSTSLAVSPPQFTIKEVCATSTPTFPGDNRSHLQPYERGLNVAGSSHMRQLDTTVKNNEVCKPTNSKSPESPKYSLYNALRMKPGCSKSISNNVSPSAELQVDLSSDFSRLDRSNITLRTPHSKSATKFRRSSLDQDKESDIMTFVDLLLASEQDAISQEAQERCDRLVQTTDQTQNALHSALDNILIPEDDTANDHILLEDSVQIIDDSRSISPHAPTVISNDSVQLIETDVMNMNDSEVQFVAGPSMPRVLRKRKGREVAAACASNKPARKRRKNPPSATCTSEAGTSAQPTQPANNNPGKEKALRDCPICLDKLGNKEISSTICGHVFCTPCIRAAVKAQRCCPNCRTALTLKKIHPLFI